MSIAWRHIPVNFARFVERHVMIFSLITCRFFLKGYFFTEVFSQPLLCILHRAIVGAARFPLFILVWCRN